MFVSVDEVVNTFVCHLVLLYFNTTKQANTLLKERVGLLIEHKHISVEVLSALFLKFMETLMISVFNQ